MDDAIFKLPTPLLLDKVVTGLDEREDTFLNGRIHFPRRKIAKDRPLKLSAVYLSVSYFNFTTENAFIWKAEHSALLCPFIV